MSPVAAVLPTLTRHKQRRSPMGRGLLQQSGGADEESEDLAEVVGGIKNIPYVDQGGCDIHMLIYVHCLIIYIINI